MKSLGKTLGIIFVIALIIGTAVAIFLINNEDFRITEEQKTFNIKIINVDEELDPQSIIDLADQFTQASGDYILNATPLNLDRNQFSAQLGSILEGADALVFPSITHDLVRSQMDSFIPISATDTYTLPVALNRAYAANEPQTHWAVPLLIDPVVMVVKTEAHGMLGSGLPKTWSEFSTISAWMKQSDVQLPHFVFMNNASTSLSDAIAARILQSGYEHYALQDPPQSRPAYAEEQYQVLAQSMKQFNQFFKDDIDANIDELPQVTSFEGFLDSNAFFTYARYSDLAALSPMQKEQLIAYPIPYADYSINPCYAVSFAIPMTASNPGLSLDFIQFAENNLNEDILAQTNMIPAFDLNDTDLLAEPYTEKAIFVLRESPLGINQITLIDFLNGKIDLAEISVLWKRGFFIPKPVRSE